jgi:predicted AlkP superfamily pyrophosphatase or phosphodiesterase
LSVLEADYEIIMGYFSLADTIGHLSFGNKPKMRIIYKELDDLVVKAKQREDNILVVSDHGMEAISRFGDHSNYGFWSLSKKIDLGTPKITLFRQLIESGFGMKSEI